MNSETTRQGRSWLLHIVLLMMLAFGQSAAAQLSHPAEEVAETDATEQLGTEDHEEFLQALDRVLETLEDDQRREALVRDLEQLRAVADEREDEGALEEPGGLLDAIGQTFDELGGRADDEGTPVETWERRSSDALDDAKALIEKVDSDSTLGFLADAGMFLGIWSAVLVVGILLGRRVTTARGWPLALPRDPPGWLLFIHFLRRGLPWLLGFAVLLALLQIIHVTPGRITAMLVAYAMLCGRGLALVIELVISLFSRGHRRRAVAVLRRRGLKRLFLIGAIVAIANAMDTGRMSEFLGTDLSEVLALLGNGVAALVAALFILRYRRPVQHLIYNRPYHQRRSSGSTNDILRLVSRLWHVPALVLMLMLFGAVILGTGDPGDTLARGVMGAALLVLAVVVTRLINHHAEERAMRTRRITQYRERLERFGYAVAHLLTWAVFVETSLWVWGSSLFGVGQHALGARIGQALLAVGITALIAWLAWILADTGIQRGLTSTAASRGQRVNMARIQTITPLIRNVIFTGILIIAFIVALANLGVNVTPLLAGAGVIGIAIGFGAQTLVQDLITGLFILIEDSLAIDDFVDLGGVMGTVEGLSLRTVRLRDLDGILHVVPFSEIKTIHNMSRQFGIALMRIKAPLSMTVADAMQTMREVADDLRSDSHLAHHIWAPVEFQGVDRFEEGAAIVRLRIRTAPVMQWEVAREFNLRLKQRFEEDGVDLAMERFSVRMENPPAGMKGEPDEGNAPEERDSQGGAGDDGGPAGEPTRP